MCLCVGVGVQLCLSSRAPSEAQSASSAPRGEAPNKAENQPMLQRSLRAAPRFESPPGRVKAAWFQVTGDLRTQRLRGVSGAKLNSLLWRTQGDLKRAGGGSEGK